MFFNLEGQRSHNAASIGGLLLTTECMIAGISDAVSLAAQTSRRMPRAEIGAMLAR